MPAKKETEKESVFATLSAINVNKFTNEKGGLTYLSWAHAWGILLENYPDSQYEFLENKFYEDGTCEVAVKVTVDGISRTMLLPCMDYRNNAIPKPNARDISDTRMRCLVKACAMHGLGIYIYAGEIETGGETKARDDAFEAEIQLVSDEMIVLIEADDIEFTTLWHECERDRQAIIWKLFNTKQKKAARELIDQVRKDEV